MNSHKSILSVLFISAIGLSSCSVAKTGTNYTKNWQGSDLPGHIYASFDQFNGKQDFYAKIFHNGHMTVKYSTEVTNGEVRLQVISAAGTILNRNVSRTVRDSLSFNNPGNQPVQIIFLARQAAGKFDVTY